MSKQVFPNTRLPIGHVQIARRKGQPRAWVKVDHVNGRSVFRLRSHVVWEAEHGPIPPGMAIHHRDRDSLNDSIDNLQAVTAREHLEIHRREAEMARKPKLGERRRRLARDIALSLASHPYATQRS